MIACFSFLWPVQLHGTFCTSSQVEVHLLRTTQLQCLECESHNPPKLSPQCSSLNNKCYALNMMVIRARKSTAISDSLTFNKCIAQKKSIKAHDELLRTHILKTLFAIPKGYTKWNCVSLLWRNAKTCLGCSVDKHKQVLKRLRGYSR